MTQHFVLTGTETSIKIKHPYNEPGSEQGSRKVCKFPDLQGGHVKHLTNETANKKELLQQFRGKEPRNMISVLSKNCLLYVGQQVSDSF